MPTDTVVHQLAIRVGNKLRDERLMLAAAESCTGGMVAAAITDISGSSAWFERGFVTYSNLAKTEMIGVPAALIEQHGAVSEPVAKAMAEGALRNSRAQVSVSITGVAGPAGGSEAKPVGTVCFAWSNRLHTAFETQHFKGDREQVRTQAAAHALRKLLEFWNSGSGERATVRLSGCGAAVAKAARLFASAGALCSRRARLTDSTQPKSPRRAFSFFRDARAAKAARFPNQFER